MIPCDGAAAWSGADGRADVPGMPVGGIRRKGICGHRPLGGGAGSEPDCDRASSRVVAWWRGVFEPADDFVVVFDFVFQFGEFLMILLQDAFE